MENMEKDEPNNEQAFPYVAHENWTRIIPGMSLRDWFAGMALNSIPTDDDPAIIARDAYAIADAMLAARKK